MAGLSIGPDGQGARSYIPPHMRGAPRAVNGGPPPGPPGHPEGPPPGPAGPPGPLPGAPGPGQGPPQVANGGLANSAWARYVIDLDFSIHGNLLTPP